MLPELTCPRCGDDVGATNTLSVPGPGATRD
jgi:hypothetical protein